MLAEIRRQVRQIEKLECERRRVDEALRGFSKQIIETQELERTRVARELQESIAQMLVAVKYKIQSFSRIRGVREDVLRRIQEAEKLLDNAIKEVCRISHALRPSILDELGLIPALDSLGDEFRERTRIHLDVRYCTFKERLSSQLELALYRIFQEALSNVEKHSAARRVKVRLSRRGATIRLAIKDDGKGFDPISLRARKRRKPGLGLMDMRHRSEFVGGSLIVRAATGKGTEILVRTPYHVRGDGVPKKRVKKGKIKDGY